MSGIDIAIAITVGFAIVLGARLVADELRHRPSARREKRQAIMNFQDILGQRLKRHQPRILVWMDNNDARLRPHALMEAYGYIYCTRSSADEAVMCNKADEAAEYFDRKQLKEWMAND